MDFAEAALNLSQRAVEMWEGSNTAVRRELLEIVSLNCDLDSTSLGLVWNKPLDALAELAVVLKMVGATGFEPVTLSLSS